MVRRKWGSLLPSPWLWPLRHHVTACQRQEGMQPSGKPYLSWSLAFHSITAYCIQDQGKKERRSGQEISFLPFCHLSPLLPLKRFKKRGGGVCFGSWKMAMDGFSLTVQKMSDNLQTSDVLICRPLAHSRSTTEQVKLWQSKRGEHGIRMVIKQFGTNGTKQSCHHWVRGMNLRERGQ